MRQTYHFIIAALFTASLLSGCSTKLTSEKLSRTYGNQHYVIQNNSEQNWHLWWQKGMTLHRNHSRGYVLTVVDPTHQGPLSYYSNPKKAKHIGSAEGAVISIMDFYEHAMHTPTYRATANIILKDGRNYPCEIEWHSGIEKSLQKVSL